MSQLDTNTIISKIFLEEMVGASVKDWILSPLGAPGDNFAGSVEGLEVITTTDQIIPLIFKRIPDPAPEWLTALKIFRTEHAAYRSLFPILKSFAGKNGLEYIPPLPKYYAGFNNDKSDYIFLEDLRPSQYKVPAKLKSLTLPEMQLAMCELSKLHAISYAFTRQEGEHIFSSHDNLKYLMKPSTKANTPDDFDERIIMYVEESFKVLEKLEPSLSKKFEKYVSTGWKIRRDFAANEKYFVTVIHMDLWANNLLFKYDKDAQPVSVKFIDFQFMRRSHVFQELMYFIFCSTDKAFREQHLNTILNHYYDTFKTTLDSLKCPLPLGFQRDFFIDEFYKCYLPGFMHMCFAYPLQLGDIKGATTLPGDGELIVTKREIQGFYIRSPEALSRLLELAQEVDKHCQL